MLVAVLATLGAATPATAGGADGAEDTLVAAPLLSAEYDIGDTLVIGATVTAAQLVSGHLEVRGGGSTYVSRVDVEVAGGSSKEFHLLMPTSPQGGGQVVIELFDGSTSIDSDTITFTHDSGTDVAGILPVLATRVDLPPRVTLDGDVKRVNLVTIPDSLADDGIAALSQLDTIAATSDDLAQLSPAGLRTLLVWVARGGDLVLDDAADLSMLPPAWQPGESGVVRASFGVIRVDEGALSSGDWADTILPARLATTDDQFGFWGTDIIVDPRIPLSRRAGVELPNLNSILIVLGAYVVFIGPVMYLVLRRLRRLTAAWVAIPLASVLVAGGVIVTGSSWRSRGRATASAIVELSPGGAYASIDTLLFRSSAGRSSLDLADDWSAAEMNLGWYFGSGDASNSNRTFVTEGGQRRLDVGLENGQISVVSAEGSVSDSSLEVVVHSAEGDTVEGTVTNRTPWNLRSVAAFAAGSNVLVGDLAAGASASFLLKSVESSPTGDSNLGAVWPDPVFGLGFAEPQPGVDLGIWSSLAARKGTQLYPVGFVRVAGWTSERPSDVVGSERADTVTLVTELIPIEPAEGAGVRPIDVQSKFVVSPWDPNSGQPSDPVIRFDLPNTGAEGNLVLDVLAGDVVDKVEVLTGGEWVEPANFGDDGFLLSDAAVRFGTVLVRLKIDQNLGFDPSRALIELGGAPRG